MLFFSRFHLSPSLVTAVRTNLTPTEFDNATGEGWLTGRYRKLYREYLLPTGRRIPLAITELGLDSGSWNGGWRDFVSAPEYVRQLVREGCTFDVIILVIFLLLLIGVMLQQWYDSLLVADSYVIGATIFLMDGTSDWESFSVNGDAQALLANYMKP